MSDDQGVKGIAARVAAGWAELIGRFNTPESSREVAQAAVATAPVVWLVGKVQSGKSSIVRAITGASDAEVGTGFKPCTRTARVFDFPVEAPVIRFLDTRGLGETGYQPAEDLAFAEKTAHVLLIVMRALDPHQEEVLAVVRDVRRRRPSWPIVVAQTCLHDAYRPGDGHLMPYPFSVSKSAGDTAGSAGSPGVPADLERSLAHQRRLVLDAGGSGPIHFVPIDFTHPDDGFSPRHYGLEALLAAIGDAAPDSIAATVQEIAANANDRHRSRAHPLLLGHAAAAAAADLVPLAGAIAVPGVQARLLYALASQQGTAWDRRMLGEFGACLGASILTRLAARFGIRQLVKLVPVYGQTVGAAAAAATSFATTYALGFAALQFIEQRRAGSADPAAVAAAYRDGLARAFELARSRNIGDGTPPPAPTDKG